MSIDIDKIGLDDGTELYKLLRPFVTVLVERGWTDSAAALDYALPFDLANEGVQRVLEQLGTRVKDIAETTRDDIQRLVGQAAEDGWSTARLAAALQEKRELASRSRAELVAVTETAQAYTQGSLTLYAESGVVSEVEWLLGPDSCAICEEIATETPRVPLGETFYGGAMVPAHPRCTCAIAPVV